MSLVVHKSPEGGMGYSKDIILLRQHFSAGGRLRVAGGGWRDKMNDEYFKVELISRNSAK